MNWYKAFHGLPYDPQLAVVAKRAGITRAEILALMIALMDHASQNNPRGSLERLDAEKLSLALDLDVAKIETSLQALRDKALIGADNILSDWAGRQNTSTDRVRAFRARHRLRKRMERNGIAEDDTPDAIAARHARLRGRNGSAAHEL
jgi:hypothetical protein